MRSVGRVQQKGLRQKVKKGDLVILSTDKSSNLALIIEITIPLVMKRILDSMNYYLFQKKPELEK